MKHISMHLKALTAAFLLCATTLPAAEISVSAPDSPTLRFALAELEKTLVHWKRLAQVTEKFNQLPVASNWRSPFSWTLLIPDVEKDIEVAKAPLTSAK